MSSLLAKMGLKFDQFYNVWYYKQAMREFRQIGCLLRGICVYLLMQLCLSLLGQQQCCSQLSNNNQCLRCPDNMHEFMGICIYNIKNCKTYVDGFDCKQCFQDYFLLKNNSCIGKNQAKYAIPTIGFVQQNRSQNKIKNQQLIFENALIQKYRNQTDIQVVIIYKFEPLQSELQKLVVPVQPNSRFYRVIFSTSRGIHETVFHAQQPKIAPISSTNGTGLSNLTFLKTINFFVFQNETYGDLQTDPFIKKIWRLYNSNQQKLKDDLIQKQENIIDCFKSITKMSQDKMKASYRIFVVSPNLGLRKRDVEFQATDADVSSIIQSININSMSQSLTFLINSIRNWEGLKARLQGGQLIALERYNRAVYVKRYNASFLFSQSKDADQSIKRPYVYYLLFDVYNETKVLISKSFIARFNPYTVSPDQTFSQNKASSAPLPALTFKVNVKQPNEKAIDNVIIEQLVEKLSRNVTIPNSVPEARPSFKALSSSMKYQQFFNKSLLFDTTTYKAIHKFLTLYYNEHYLNAQMVRASVGQNDTHLVYEFVYQNFNADNRYSFFTLALNKQDNKIQLIRSFYVPQNDRIKIQIDDQNRDTIYNTLDNTTKQIINQSIQSNPLFRDDAKIYEINSISYTRRETNEPPDVTKRYSFKYYYPNALDETFQFVQFRVELLQKNGTKVPLGNVLFPKQFFTQFDLYDNEGRKNAIQDIIRNSLQVGSEVQKVNYLQSYESLARNNIFRVEMNVDQKYLLLYEIDTLNAGTRVLSNVTIPKIKVAEPTPIKYVQSLISVGYPYYTRYYTPIFPRNPDHPAILTSKQIKTYISLVLNIQPDLISDVLVQGVTRSIDNVETYTVDFFQLYGPDKAWRRGPTRFFFHIDNRVLKSP